MGIVLRITAQYQTLTYSYAYPFVDSFFRYGCRRRYRNPRAYSSWKRSGVTSLRSSDARMPPCTMTMKTVCGVLTSWATQTDLCRVVTSTITNKIIPLQGDIPMLMSRQSNFLQWNLRPYIADGRKILIPYIIILETWWWFSTETGHRFLPLSVVLVRCRRLQDLLVLQSTTKSTRKKSQGNPICNPAQLRRD